MSGRYLGGSADAGGDVWGQLAVIRTNGQWDGMEHEAMWGQRCRVGRMEWTVVAGMADVDRAMIPNHIRSGGGSWPRRLG
jgi:hypothetical protein